MKLETLHKISYGLYVICSKNGEKINGQIANVVFQVTAKPATIAISINKDNLTHEYIEKSSFFTVSILSEDATMGLIGNFGFKSGRDIEKFKDVKYNLGKNNLPIILDNVIACMEAKVIDKIDVGSHTIFIGRVEDADIISEGKPMTYEYYHKVKGGFSPKNAPTYYKMIDKEKEKEKEKMDKYVCKICGYVYDPEAGDPDNGIKPGTKFEELPDDWVCPLCGASKSDFEKQA